MLSSCGIFFITLFVSCRTTYGFQENYLGMDFLRLFDDGVCKKQCKTRVHTMCDSVVKSAEKCPYAQKQVYEMENFVETPIKNLMIMGHNGMRNRIAIRMRVTDMAEMMWDDDLERMAKNYAHLCKPFENDECVGEESDFTSNEKYNIIKSKENLEKYIGQNRFCTVQPYFPRDLVELTLKNWYFQKNGLAPPVEHEHEHIRSGVAKVTFKYKVLKGLNNFTHLAYELSFRFGCSLARYDDLYCMFCFYFPHFYNKGSLTTFKFGKPASDCPPQAPLPSEMFPELCSEGMGQMGDMNTCAKFRENASAIASCIFIVYLFVLMFLSK